MDAVIFLALLAAFYAVCFFFDCFFKSCMHYPYVAFLSNTGLTLQFMRLRLHTTAFNRTVFRWGTGSATTRNWLAKFYGLGVLVALSLLPISLILIFVMIFNGNEPVSSDTTGQAAVFNSLKLEILLPGVNLPLEEIGYYVTTMLCATLIHESGHALSAVIEEVPVTGFGFQLYFCFPLAYTETSADHFAAIKWVRKLRILCAGIWHNCLCAFSCYLLVSSLSILAAPFYVLNERVIVTSVAPDSLLAAGNRGLTPGDIVTHINDCRVRDAQTLYACLLQALQQKPGYCVSSDFIRLHDESIALSQHHDAQGVLQCCDSSNQKLCCFEYLDDLSNDAPVEIPQHVCLDVRRTLTDAYGYCGSSGDCERGFCLRPLLHNRTTIMSFKRHETSGIALPQVIYLGHPADVARTVTFSGFVPKNSFFWPQLGDMFLLFLQYNIVFNIGLAFVNVIPCFGFDGYYIVKTIINSFLAKRVVERPKREFIATIVTGLGTLLCALALAKMLWLNLTKVLF